MSYALAAGSKFFIADTYGPSKTVTGITNANPAVLTATGGGFVVGDILEIDSGWSDLQDSMARVKAVNADAFTLEGIDTSDTNTFPAGGGAGTTVKVATWIEVTQILKFDASGGEPTYATAKPLSGKEVRIPNGKSAAGIDMELGDDSTQAWYGALDRAYKAGTPRAFKLVLKGGDVIFYNGFVFFDRSPTMDIEGVRRLRASVSFVSDPIRYVAA